MEWQICPAQALFGIADNHSKREYQIQSYNASLKGSYKSYTVASQIGLGWDFKFKNTIVGPYTNLELNYVNQEGFKENGGATSLKLGSSNDTSLKLNLGAHLKHLHEINASNAIGFDLSIAYKHEFTDEYYKSNSGCKDYIVGFDSRTKVAAKDALELYGSISYMHKPSGAKLSLYTNYESSNANDTLDIGLQGRLDF